MTTRIMLAEDHHIVRQGLHKLLDEHSDLTVVGEAADGRTALACAKELSPNIIILDIGLPGLNGVYVAKQVLAEQPAIKIIALSMHANSQFVDSMLKAGAAAYLVKDSVADDLIKAIRSVLAGDIYLSPRAAKVLVEERLRGHTDTSHCVYELLSSRQREVLQLLVEGKSVKEIAGELHISINTVNTHRQDIMKSLKVNNLAELVKYAIREGLTSL